MSKDYAEQRASILRDLDGLTYDVDAAKKVGHLWLDRPQESSKRRRWNPSGVRQRHPQAADLSTPPFHKTAVGRAPCNLRNAARWRVIAGSAA